MRWPSCVNVRDSSLACCRQEKGVPRSLNRDGFLEKHGDDYDSVMQSLARVLARA